MITVSCAVARALLHSLAMNAKTLIAMHDVDHNHLASVASAMRTLGSPTVRAIDCGGLLYLIEGTHRVAAAKQLGVPVNVSVVADDHTDESDIVTGLDIDDRSAWTVGELRDYVADRPARDLEGLLVDGLRIDVIEAG